MQKITKANFYSDTMTALIDIINEVGGLYDSEGISFEYDIYNGERYCVKFKLYGRR